MASQISLNRSVFEEKKGTLHDAVSGLKSNADALNTLKESTVNAWEGEARDKYNQDMTTGLEKINELIQVLQQFDSTMEQVLSTYEQAESKNVGLV